ncbi:hypothetical protein LSAT2_017330 [Lamellibrachia satsuma]|nr:hypothetical protein LSAT2_017330 [Lamellibrachia satsuma]
MECSQHDLTVVVVGENESARMMSWRCCASATLCMLALVAWLATAVRAQENRADWVDPNDMLNFDPTSGEMRKRPTEKRKSEIPRPDNQDYLGITINMKLSWQPHIDKVQNKARKMLNLIKRTLHKAPPKLHTRYSSDQHMSRLLAPGHPTPSLVTHTKPGHPTPSLVTPHQDRHSVN